MYPNVLFLGLNLYDILTAVGIVSALVVFRIGTDIRKMPLKYQRVFLFIALIAICTGYLFAALIQGLYEVLAGNEFTMSKITFFGGLMGGATVFLLAELFVEKVVIEKENRPAFHAAFSDVVDVAPCCIAIAHAFGRLGCLMGGCCYGRPMDAWYGVSTPFESYKVVPLQLFEALFLFALFIVLIWLYKKQYHLSMPTYLIGYGVWRFVLEFFRDDEQGATLVSFLSPSQLTSVLAVALGIILLILKFYQKQKKNFGK